MIGLIASGQKPQLYGNGQNVRDWIHVDDHNDGVWAIIDRGQIGETYLLGASNERSNLQVVQVLLNYFDRPNDWIEFITDRPGHDLRYAIDASRARQELGWNPVSGSFEEQLRALIPFYIERLGT